MVTVSSKQRILDTFLLRIDKLSSAPKAVIGQIVGITGWDPSVCKSSRLQVNILQFSLY